MWNYRKKNILNLFCLFCISVLLSCNKNGEEERQNRTITYQTKQENSYKPGFGEFMSAIQAHHTKLWFAGTALNWELANFEIDEINENIESIKKFCQNRNESKSLAMLAPAIDSVKMTIKSGEKKYFLNCFTLLTNTCNNCHKENNFGFIIIRIPAINPFTNQDFKNIK